MWLKKIKQKKLQFSLVGVILVFTSMIFVGCLGFVFQTSQLEDKYFSFENAPDLLYVVTKGGAEKLQADLPNKKYGLLDIKEACLSEANLTVANQRVTSIVTPIVKLANTEAISWQFEAESEKGKLINIPNNQVLVSKVFADIQRIKIGDSIQFSKETPVLKVGGFYTTPTVPASTIGLRPYYVNPKTFDKLTGLKPVSFINISRHSESESLADFKNSFSEDFLKTAISVLDRGAFIMSFSMVNLLLGGIGSVAALVVFIAGIFVIRFILKNDLQKEYRSIGIYKALGFTHQEIRRFYLNGYLVIGGVAILIGSCLGLILEYSLGTSSVKYLGDFVIGRESLLVVLLSSGLLLAILIVNVYLIVNKTRKIEPVAALTNGLKSTKQKMKKSLLKNAHSPLAMAINDGFKHKKTHISMVLILAVSFFLIFLFSSINYTVQSIGSYPEKWFSFPKSEHILSVELTQDEQDYLKNNPYIDWVIFGQSYLLLPTESQDIDTSNLNYSVLSDFTKQKTQIPYIKGREPKEPKEIAISENIAKHDQLKAGDYISLTIAEQTADYLISGIYQTMLNGGYQIQMPAANLEELQLDYLVDLAFIQLKNPQELPQLKSQLKKDLGMEDVYNSVPMIDDAIVSIGDIANPITMILVGVFSLFSLLNIVNLLITNNNQRRQTYSILKALGFTNQYIYQQNLIQLLGLTIISLILGVSGHYLLSPLIFNQLIGINALVTPWWLVAVIISLILSLILALVSLFNLPLTKISPIELMEE